MMESVSERRLGAKFDTPAAPGWPQADRGLRRVAQATQRDRLRTTAGVLHAC
jgi:hypothetical protein